MKITFLGTASGKTSAQRYHSSLLFSLRDYNLLIDTGDGISRALINSEIEFNSVNGILITHLHPDHFSGLPALIVQMKMINRVEPLEIFIHESLIEVLRESLIQSYLLPERIGFDIQYKVFKDSQRYIINKEFSFLARKNSHFKNLEKYQYKYPHLSLYSASFLFEFESKKIIYTSDVGSEEDLLLFKEVKSDLYIAEATHIPLKSLINAINNLNSDLFYLTHYLDEDLISINEIMTKLPTTIKKKLKIAGDRQLLEI